MKKIIKVLLVVLVLGFTGCGSVKVKKEDKVAVASQLKEPYLILNKILKEESLISAWYNDPRETPVEFLQHRQIIKPKGKEETFLNGLKNKEATSEDIKRFNQLTEKYLNKLSRRFKLKDENIKNTKKVIQRLVIGYNMEFNSLEKHWMTDVATDSEREKILKWNEKTEDEMTEKDRKRLRKLLNKWLKRREFFDVDAYLSAGVSDETLAMVKLSKKTKLTSLEKNNLNVTALKAVFPKLISPLSKWGK